MKLRELFSRFIPSIAPVATEDAPQEQAAWNSPYDSANYSDKRSRVPGGAPKDGHLELTEGVRSDISEKTRYLSKSSGIFREIVRDNVIYSIGDGIRVQPLGQDKAWKDEALEIWDDASRAMDITGRFSLKDIQTLTCSGNTLLKRFITHLLLLMEV